MLSVKGLYKSFEAADGQVRAVRGITFELQAGEVYALLGPSGCGKTTTLRCIAGLEQPQGGEIKIGNTLVAAPDQGIHVPAYNRDIGMVFQSYAIWPHMDVFGNVAYPLQVSREKSDRAEIHARVMQVLQLVGMESMARRPATQLSGGQQQRVALARALVRRPSLLLLDEPLSNLDAKLREQMRHELKDMIDQTMITTLYVTHDQSEALAMADRIAVMADGVIAQEGEPSQVYSRPGTSFVAGFLGVTNFLPASVSDSATGLVVIGDGAASLQVVLPNNFARGERVELVVRPEDVELHRTEPPPANGVCVLEGSVERLVFQGGHVECVVRCAEEVLRITVHPANQPQLQDRVWLTFRSDRCVMLRKGEQANGRAS